MLANMSVEEFCGILGSAAPAPGGGSAAALTGALGAALTSMVCCLTLGKKKYADNQAFAEQTKAASDSLRERFLAAMERDTAVFGAMSAAYGMAKDTEEQKKARSAAIQQALRGCTEVPLEMMDLAAEAAELTGAAVGRTTELAVSDLGVAALELAAAVRSAWLNVLINIGLMADKDLAQQYRQRGEALLQTVSARCEQIYADVVQRLA